MVVEVAQVEPGVVEVGVEVDSRAQMGDGLGGLTLGDEVPGVVVKDGVVVRVEFEG